MSIETVSKGTSSSASALLEEPLEDNLLTQVLDEQSEQEFENISSSIADYRTTSTQGSMASRTAETREFIAFEFSLVPEVECVFTAFRKTRSSMHGLSSMNSTRKLGKPSTIDSWQ